MDVKSRSQEQKTLNGMRGGDTAARNKDGLRNNAESGCIATVADKKCSTYLPSHRHHQWMMIGIVNTWSHPGHYPLVGGAWGLYCSLYRPRNKSRCRAVADKKRPNLYRGWGRAGRNKREMVKQALMFAETRDTETKTKGAAPGGTPPPPNSRLILY